MSDLVFAAVCLLGLLAVLGLMLPPNSAPSQPPTIYVPVNTLPTQEVQTTSTGSGCLPLIVLGFGIGVGFAVAISLLVG